jgi:hypothetical protein
MSGVRAFECFLFIKSIILNRGTYKPFVSLILRENDCRKKQEKFQKEEPKEEDVSIFLCS